VPNLLLATDADYVYDEVDAALGGPYAVHRVRHGADVLPAVKQVDPVVVLLDLQIGNMGGMAACMAIRLEESAGRLDHIPVLMLLDRDADLFLARRSHADGWLVKPLDAFRLRRAAEALLSGGEWFEHEQVEASMGVTDAPEPG
jgi:DNA-binding response OmpR family regulator